MSTSFDIVCLQCFTEVEGWGGKPYQRHADTGFDDCRWPAMLEKLLPIRDALAMVGDTLRHPDCWWLTDSRGAELARACDFFAAHRGHPLEVRDEYGASLEQRREEEAKWKGRGAGQ